MLRAYALSVATSVTGLTGRCVLTVAGPELLTIIDGGVNVTGRIDVSTAGTRRDPMLRAYFALVAPKRITIR